MSTLTSSWQVRVAAAVLVQLALVAVAVSGQLSARLTGEEYAFRVAPLDPIDPFRGAYVSLDYPDLPRRADLPGGGDVYLPLVADGEFWAAGAPVRARPDIGPYLACTDRNGGLECGIDSWFLPQDEAQDLETAVAGGDAVARVRIDDRGHAALVTVEVR